MKGGGGRVCRKYCLNIKCYKEYTNAQQITASTNITLKHDKY